MIKSIAITGGSRGIGRAISLKLAKDGYNIAIGDLQNTENDALSVVDEIKKLGQKAIYVPTDVSKKNDVLNLVRTTEGNFGGFDVMINNAGICKVEPLLNLSGSDIDDHINVNVKGVLYGIQAASEVFIKNHTKGKIINAASIAAHVGVPTLGAYSASKFAVKSLTQSAAQELAKYDITVNAYCPGPVSTGMFDDIIESTRKLGATKGEAEKNHLSSVALGRMAYPEDVAGLVSFLVNDNSNFITGQSIVVDGGIIYN